MGGVAGKEYPEGQLVATWMGIGIAMFAGFGTVLATTTGNPGLIGIGPAVGVAVGAAVGTGLEDKARQEGRIRPLDPAQRRRARLALLAGVALLVAGVALTMLLL